MRTAFPENYVPSLKLMKRKIDETVKLALTTTLSCSELILLDFESDMLLVLKRNLNSIFEYNSTRSTLKEVNIPPFFELSDKITSLLFSMNFDGVSFINSKNRRCRPSGNVFFNLPPVIRCKFANIILSNLQLGEAYLTGNFFPKIRKIC